MDWTQTLTIVGTNIVLLLGSIGTTITLFLWARREAAEDRKENGNDRREMTKLIGEIQQEMKDFHGRLCAIKEKNKGK